MFLPLSVRGRHTILSLLFLVPLAACKSGPTPINYGNELCARCSMTISDTRYGAEIVSPTGKVYKFDSVECMAGYYLTGNLSDRPKAKLYVTDFSKPKTLIGARTAFYLKSPDLPSPMGMNVSAFNDMEELRAIQSKYSGTVLTWDDVLALWSKVHG